MVVSKSGDAYVGNLGIDLMEGTKKHGWEWIRKHALDPENLGVIFRVDGVGFCSIRHSEYIEDEMTLVESR